MEAYPWWTEEQKRFSREMSEFVKEIMPRDAQTRWTREFPWDIFEKIGGKGYCGAAIPREYGGLGLGATGACIVLEEVGRMPGIGRALGGNMLGGLRQVMEFGTEEQKKAILPRIAEGEIGAIVITEPFAGTDAAAIETTARRQGDMYVLRGKKRYIVSAGVARRHMVYARTSNDPEDIRTYRHLTAFLVERGVPGFSVEKINEVMGFSNIQNGVLDFDDVRISVADRIGEEGQGWRVMTGGLNFERTMISAQAVGWLKELLSNVVPYAQRRVQFGKPTIDIPTNQFKIADLIMRLKIARLLTYYDAYLWDLGKDITIESNLAKVYNCESAIQGSLDAIQVMGGDGVTPFYPLEEIMAQAKVENIAGGTMEACRLVIFRSAMRLMADEFRMRRREIDPDLGVPVPLSTAPEKEKDVDETKLLAVLAEDYRVNPGLYMSRDDMTGRLALGDEALDALLASLEKQGLAKLVRTKKGIELAKATYEGLTRAHPLDYYRWFPSWIANDKERVF